eukprot:3300617-Prymnesium_polylepis.1
MCSAFAHVIADTMRTLTVMGCALLVSVGGFDSERTDAVGSLVVCCIILGIAAYIGHEALVQLRSHLRHAAAPPRLPAECTSAHALENLPSAGVGGPSAEHAHAHEQPPAATSAAPDPTLGCGGCVRPAGSVERGSSAAATDTEAPSR